MTNSREWGPASRDDFRNRVEVVWTDSAGTRRVAVAAHHESYEAMGKVWRTVVLVEPNIDNLADAEKMARLVLADLCFL